MSRPDMLAERHDRPRDLAPAAGMVVDAVLAGIS